MNELDTYVPSSTVLNALKIGNQDAFEELYFYYSNKIYASILRMVKSAEVAEDLLQLVFLKVWDNRQTIDVDKSFKSYLYRISENVVYDYFRKVARDRELLSKMILHAEESYRHVDCWLDNKENKQILEEAIAQLSPKRQQIYRLSKLDGHSYEQISTMLGISTSTVNDHVVKGSKVIKEFLRNSHYYIPVLILISI